MNKFLSIFKSKTVWGSIFLGASFLPQLYDYKEILQAGGVALGGVGVAHKLDKIKTATEDNTAVENIETQKINQVNYENPARK